MNSLQNTIEYKDAIEKVEDATDTIDMVIKVMAFVFAVITVVVFI